MEVFTLQWHFKDPKLPLSPQSEQGLIRWSNMVASYVTDATDIVLATLRISAYIQFFFLVTE